MADTEREARLRRRAQEAEDKLFDVTKDATTALAGVRGTSRSTDSDVVTVEFTDAGWEACKRLLSHSENAEDQRAS